MNTRPKVIYIAGNIPLPTRNSNKVILDLAKRLSCKYDISVIFPKEFCPFPINRLKKFRYLRGIPGNWKYNEIDIKSLGYIRIPSRRYPFAMIGESGKRLLDLLHSDRPVLLHSHFVLPDGYMAMTASKRLGIPYIISFRKSDIDNIGKASGDEAKYRETLCGASAIIVHNRYQQEFLQTRFGLDSRLIPHGVDESFLKERTLLPKDEIIVTAVGSMIGSKRFGWVIRAVKEYTGKKIITLRLVGDGPLSDSLRAEAGGAENIIFCGRQPHDKVSELLAESDIFALPSEIETFGMVYLEAAAAMNAVIAVRNTGVWGNFEDGKEMLFTDGYQDFKDKLYRLTEDDALRIGIAEKASRRVREEYVWDKIVSRYDALYQEIISRH